MSLSLRAGATDGAIQYNGVDALTLNTTDGVGGFITNDPTSGLAHIPARQYFHLTADGGAITTIANFFGTNSNPVLISGAYYEIEIEMFFLKTTANVVTWTLTNSAAPTSQNIDYLMSPVTGIVTPPGTATMLQGQYSKDATAARTIATASLSNGVDHYCKIKMWIQNGTGTSLLIQAAATTGSLTPRIGSNWKCTRILAGNTGTFHA